MGVAGCGKSTLAQQFAESHGLHYIEGDSFHPAANLQKMQTGMALNDADRQGWLRTLGQELQACPGGAVLSCSALKRSYRDILRQCQPGLRFAFLDISPEESLARVRSRSGQHLFPPSLVQSQFDSLERPDDESDAITLDGTASTAELCEKIEHWLRP